MSNPESTQVSSPASTGNAGGEFEKHVDAVFLSLLLVRGIPPILTDCARASRDAADFEHRLTTPGFVHAKVNRNCNAIREIVEKHEGRTVTLGELWPFLRALHVLSFDLNSSTRQTESLIKGLLAHTTQEQDPLAAADASWSDLLREVGEGMPTAKSYRRDDLPASLRERHAPPSTPTNAHWSASLNTRP